MPQSKNDNASTKAMNRPTSNYQRRLVAVLLITLAGLVIILTLFSSPQLGNDEEHHHSRRRRRRLQGVMGIQGGGLIDPKTVELKGGTNMVYIPPNNNNNNAEPLLHQPLLHLHQQQLQQAQQIQQQVQQQQQQQQQVQQQVQPIISSGYSNSNQQYVVPPQQQQQQVQAQQFLEAQPLPQQQQQQQPLQQFTQPQIPQDNNINTINTSNNNYLTNPINNNNIAPNNNPIQVTPQNPIPTSTNTNTTPTTSIIKPYNINNILLTLKSFRYQGFFFIYNSSTNEFVIVHSTPDCDKGCVRIYRIASIIAYALRKNFPERFPSEDNAIVGNAGGAAGAGGGGDLVFAISTGDVPRIHQYCLSPSTNYCSSTNFGPILQFGSIFVNTDYMPSMIAMPQPVRPHMPCFDEWQLHGTVCMDLQPAKVAAGGDGDGEEFNGISSFASGLVFGQELGLVNTPNYWNDLIPQIIWRGTDFVFLHTMFPKMRRPEYQRDIAKKESTRRGGENKRWAIDALWEMGEQLQPRWRGVLLTSEAELEAEEFREGGDITLPWVNIKFASCNFGGKKVDAGENTDFVKLQSVGIKAIGERVNMQEQAKYRYHIDLGGGGGTSWTGTIEKLALPGVLFHHVTPTKDWFYDRLQPWVHYIPVDSDLTDLREKFEWAESHPVEAQKIAEAGTEFARWIGTPEGFGELYQQHLVAPLRGIINAYQPPPDASDAGKSVLDIIKEKGSSEYTVVSRCSGSYQYSCKDLDGKIPNGG